MFGHLVLEDIDEVLCYGHLMHGYAFGLGPFFIPSPFGSNLGLRPFPIKDIIHNGEKSP